MTSRSSGRGHPVGSRDVFLVLVAGLSLFGIAMVYSAGVVNVPDPVTAGAWVRQAAWLGIAAVAFAMVALVPPNWLQWGATGGYAVSMVMLAATLVIGTGRGTAAGVKSWIDLGPVGFQPSEVAKLATILCLAYLLSKRGRRSWESLRDLVPAAGIAGLPLALVLLQPDLGTAMAFVGIFFAALYWADVPVSLLALAASPGLAFVLAGDTLVWSVYMVLLICFVAWRAGRPGTRYLVDSGLVIALNLGAGAIASPLWNSLATYQRNRILVWLDPAVDPQGSGYQIIQSKAAIGSGGITGLGFAEGPQKGLGFLPERHTDFIFSVVGEELGFVGAALVVVSFGLLLGLLVRMATRCREEFGGIVIAGVAGAWFVHVFVNVGMTVGLAPITGIPLPFVSYGGTFLLMSWVAVAVCWRLAGER